MFCKKYREKITTNTGLREKGLKSLEAHQKTPISTSKSRRKLFIVFIALVLTVFLSFGIYHGLKPAYIHGPYYNDAPYYRAKAMVLGQYLGNKYPNQKALIIFDNLYLNNRRFWDKILFLGKGLGDIDKLEIDTIRLNKMEKDWLGHDGELIMPLEEVMAAKDFDAAVAAHPNCSIIISFVNLPRDKMKLKFWNNKDKHLVMFNANIFVQKGDIEAGRITVAVSFKPGVKLTEKPAPTDPQVAFNERYILITTENIAQMERQYPKLFK